MQDLVQQILQEQDRPEGADTSIWLAWDKVTRQNVIKLYLPRWNTIKALQGKTVINLDATPYPLLQRLFPAMKPVRHAVPENMHVTQITDSKLTGRSLESPATRRLVEEALRHVCANAERPLIFCPKKYNPGIEDNEGRAFQLEHPGTLWGHYGRDNRAINDTGMMAADVLVAVGTPHHPPNELRAELQAFRGAEMPPARLADAEHTHKPYAYQDAAGRGKALRQRVDPDPEAQAFIDHQVAAEILQAIGRARPALRTGDPLRVFLLTAFPIDGLPIDALTTLKELARRPSNLANLNQQRQADASNRILAAQAANPEARSKGLAKLAKSNRRTVRKVLGANLSETKTYQEGGFLWEGGGIRSEKE